MLGERSGDGEEAEAKLRGLLDAVEKGTFLANAEWRTP
jgi:hypothetical protein